MHEQGTGRPGPPLYRSIGAFIRDARHNQLLAVPAGLYAVNNYLKFAMQLYFKPTTAKMLGNLKVCLSLTLLIPQQSQCSHASLRTHLHACTSVCVTTETSCRTQMPPDKPKINEFVRNYSCAMHLLQILVIAVLMKWVLKRTFSVFQWEALLLLVAGITVNQLNYCK